MTKNKMRPDILKVVSKVIPGPAPRSFFLLVLTVAILAGTVAPSNAGVETVLTIAVSANAERAVAEITGAFERTYVDIKVRLVSGSTAKLYSQIVQGAPFDIFFSADTRHPELLEARGLTRDGTRFTYARGLLALWTPDHEIALDIDSRSAGLTWPERLAGVGVKRIAVANPTTAPYGKAAIEALTALGDGHLDIRIQQKIIYGESVSQAFNFVRSGNAEVAIVALSTLYGQSGRRYLIDEHLHTPIMQQAVVLKRAPAEALEFAEFARSAEAALVLKKYGYGLPEETLAEKKDADLITPVTSVTPATPASGKM